MTASSIAKSNLKQITNILQSDLIQLQTWSNKWQMEFSISKCVHLSIGTSIKSAAAVILRARKAAYRFRRVVYLDLGSVFF